MIMEWRCTWCGKPHDADDPPCDECGHHKFERAIEQLNESDGQDHGPVWACTECDREHQKHSPPCSRCGNAQLEKRQPQYDELDDLGGTSFVDVLEPKYAAGYLLVAVLVGSLALGVTGLITVPFVGSPDAPGHAESYGNLSLDSVEDAYVEELNDRRTAEDASAVSSGAALDDAAAAYNKQWVRSEYGDADDPTPRDAVNQHDPNCNSEITFAPHATSSETVENFDVQNESAVARGLQIFTLGDPNELLEERYDSIGVDIHVAPDERIFVTVFVCNGGAF
ncbi:conserved hypothetical protein [Halomicrobium mukohataei DSM 12286]|uniref:Zinc ribbon domain-containing protein n=2 Tax=Halomicrobium mukohataei TaxID=57705 RepID=C7P4Q4_HALMD|nr:conserved hypothetical protein [Halomicrobium mukohataei DSM 12286]